MINKIRHGSLFSGIGGFDLAAEWMGWENVFHCEWENFPRKVLNYYWLNAISYGDIKQTNFTIHRGQIDILTGGFPCQPYSQAGKRLGKEDDRHLWPEMLRAIREIQPRWIVGENVRGLTNWNGGLVFDEVQADLETEGYEVTPFILPACAVNAPHRRDRIWFVAHSIKRTSGEGIATDTSNQGLQGGKEQGGIRGSREGRNQQPSRPFRTNWQDFPTQSPLRGGDDGLSDRLDGITFPKWRNESIKAYGNAVVPQVVFEIFKAIEQYDKQ